MMACRAIYELNIPGHQNRLSLSLNSRADPNARMLRGCTGAEADYIETNGYFMITSVAVWGRVDAVISNAYTPNSQFYPKTQVHEQQHKDDYDNGYDGHMFVQKAEFEPMVIGLTNSTLEGLRVVLTEELFGWYLEEEVAEMWDVLNEMEDRAYRVSDAEPPFYVYQRGGL